MSPTGSEEQQCSSSPVSQSEEQECRDEASKAAHKNCSLGAQSVANLGLDLGGSEQCHLRPRRAVRPPVSECQGSSGLCQDERKPAVDRLIDSLPDPPVGPQRREYSGKFNVRVPKSLHAALASEAEAEGVSLNQLVVAKLALHLQVR